LAEQKAAGAAARSGRAYALRAPVRSRIIGVSLRAVLPCIAFMLYAIANSFHGSHLPTERRI